MSRTASFWNVVSAGPSRAFLRRSDLADGPVVTINRAVDIIDRGITVDFACFADPPNAIVEVLGLEKYLQPPIQVWCPRSAVYAVNGIPHIHDNVTLWEPFLPASVGIRTTPYGMVESPDKTMKRYMFALLAALQRVALFKPTTIRILCADMMGSWAPGLSEAECEMHQSELEQCRREKSSAQKKLVASRGQDMTAKLMLQQACETEAALLKIGDPGPFKRWEHERNQLKLFEEEQKAKGCAIEWVQPREVIVA